MSRKMQWKVVARSGGRVQKELEADLEADRQRRRFKIVKSGDKRFRAVEAKPLPSRAEIKAELKKLSPEERRELHERLNPSVGRLEKADDGKVNREYAGRPLLVSDRTGGEKRLGDETPMTKRKRVSMDDVANQPAFDGVDYRRR